MVKLNTLNRNLTVFLIKLCEAQNGSVLLSTFEQCESESFKLRTMCLSVAQKKLLDLIKKKKKKKKKRVHSPPYKVFKPTHSFARQV